MRRMKKVMVWLVAICLMLSLKLPVMATSDATPAVADAREGVLQIRLYYVDNNGNEYAIQGGSGFLVGAASGATTVITNNHVITISEEDEAAYSERFGVDFSNANDINLKIKVVVKRDVEIDASYVNGSEQTDFAILELQQAIYDRAPLQLANSDEVIETQAVYALGFPSVASFVQDDQVFTSADVTITNGIVGKFQDVNSIGFILHNVALGHGNSGGPLVNTNGDVIGVNTMFTNLDNASNYYYSIAINEITDVLDALGITYETADGAAEESEPVPEEETTSEPDSEAVTEPEPEATIEPTPEPAPEPDIALEPAEPETNYALIFGVVGGVILIAVIAVVAVVVSKKSSSKKKVAPMNSGFAPSGPNGQPVPKPNVQPHVGGMPPIPPQTMPVDSGAGETSVLGVGETSVLGGGAAQLAATLTRRKNNEAVRITKPNFVIGRERQKVDFCVPDNNSVGRAHASIVYKGGVYYIIDKNSTNFTFVNGNKISPNQEVRLNSGDKIKLADEEFDFRI